MFWYPVKSAVNPTKFSQPITQVPSKIPSQTQSSSSNDDIVESSDDFKIVIVLDESGSMSSIQHDMVKAINNLITEQKQITERPARFTLVKFNDYVNRTIRNVNLKDVTLLSTSDYIPQRSTALYDAIGSTIDWFRYEKNVLMVIVTDGQENASQQYSKQQVTQMLEEKQKHRNWSYVYLSNDLSTAAQGDSLGFKESKWSSNRVVDQSAFANFCSRDINHAISNYRKTGMSVQAQLNPTASVKDSLKPRVFY